MAYITTEEVAEIRKELKETLGPKGFKFSVRKRHHMAVAVTITAGPADFSRLLAKENMAYAQINPYHTEFYGEHAELFETIIAIIKSAPAKATDGRAWYDKSDSQTDYFDTAFYINLNVGDFEKPYRRTA